jgi:hypothetical protein
LWDDKVEGFGLLAYSSGRKVFVVQSRKGGGRGRRLKLKTESLLSVSEARVEAKPCVSQIEGGLDAAQARRQA